MNNLQMQLSQISAIIQECKQYIKQIQNKKAEQLKSKQELTQIKKIIRQKRIELTQLKYQIKRNKTNKRQTKDVVKLSELLQLQVKNCQSLNAKQLNSYEKVYCMASNMQQQVRGLEIKILKVQAELDKSESKKKYFKHQEKASAIYQELKKQLGFVSAQTRGQKDLFNKDFREKEQKINILNSQMQQTDSKYESLCQKIEIQRQIIENIKNSQLKQTSKVYMKEKTQTKVAELEQSKSNYFQSNIKNQQKLSFLQKIEVQDILLRQQHKKEQQDIKMGQILKQNIRDGNNAGRIINNRYRFDANFSSIHKIDHPQAKTQSFDSKADLYYLNTSNHLNNLQYRKRIRTRYTEMQRYSHQYRNALLNQLEDKSRIEPLPQSSILKVYTELKKNSPVKSKAGKIEIFKVVKDSNKRKYLKSQTGAFQFGDQI